MARAPTYRGGGAAGAKPPIQLRKFNPSTMLRDSAVVVLLAPKNSGKSTLLADLMWAKRHLPAGFCFSATEESNEFFSRMVPPAFCYNGLNIDKLTKVYNHQKLKVNAYKHGDRSRDPTIFGVIEDCMAEKRLFRKTIIRDLFMNGRHRKMLVLITVQYLTDLPPCLRTNVDYFFILRQSNIVERKKYHQHIASCCGTWDEFTEIFNKCTDNHRCMVIDNGANSNETSKRVFWYKAKIRPPFRVGCARYWRFSKRNARAARRGAHGHAHAAAGSAERAARARLGRRGYTRADVPGALDARALFAQLPRAGAGGGGGGAAAASAAASAAAAATAAAEPAGVSVLLTGDDDDASGGATRGGAARGGAARSDGGGGAATRRRRR